MIPLQYIVGLLMLALLVAAVVVSYRRNRRDIEIFDVFEGGDLTQLKLCLSSRMVSRVEKRLDGLGWRLVDSKPQEGGFTSVLFEKSGDPTAQPMGVVLNRLNRSGFLSIGPLNLSKIEKQTEA